MPSSPDHPNLPFVQAAGYTRGRPDGPPLWIVVHTMEASETRLRAENTAAYFANPGDGRSVSAHYCVDDTSVVQCVRLVDSAWTVGNRPGNNRGINWEFSGFARQSRAEWLDAFGLAMFARAAPVIRSDAERYNIPLRRCSVADLKALRPGVTSHNDLRLAFGVTTHTDPGPNFPWDVFLQMLLEEDDMPTAQEIAEAVWGLKLGASGPTAAVAQQDTYRWVKSIMSTWPAQLDAILAAALDDGNVEVDASPALVAALAKLRDDMNAEVRDAVADLGEGGAAQVRADA